MSRTPTPPEVALEPLGGRYQVVRPLGIGRMTMVLEAWDRDERRRVALKFPIRQFATDEAFLARLQREVEAVVDLDHPNVAAVHGIEWDGPAGFVVVELVEGSTLWDMLATRGPLPSAGAARIAVQACTALDAAHARGLTHGHLTPANVLLRIDGRVKLTDFRLAQAARPLAAAPDPEGDLRALGRCMVVMLTGAEPAPGERVRLRPEVPAELAAIVVRAAGDHQEGYRSADDLGRDLARFLARLRRAAPVSLPGSAPAHDQPDGAAVAASQAIEPVRPPPAPAQEEPPTASDAGNAPARRRRRLGVLGLAGAGLAVVVAVVAFAGLGPDPDGQAAGRTIAGPAFALLAPATSQPPFGGGEPAPTTAQQTTAPPEATTAPPAPTTTIGGGGSSQQVTVPNVVGRDRAQAVAALTKARLGVRVVLVQVHGAGRVDRVVSQAPSAGQAVPPGSVVTLTVGTKRLPG